MKELQTAALKALENLKKLENLQFIKEDEEARGISAALSSELKIIGDKLPLLIEENEKLKSENHDLRAQLAGEHGFDVRDNVYYASDGDGPFCPYCYENRATKMRLRSLEPGTAGEAKYSCRLCESRY